jgi:hypothetical protein
MIGKGEFSGIACPSKRRTPFFFPKRAVFHDDFQSTRLSLGPTALDAPVIAPGICDLDFVVRLAFCAPFSKFAKVQW